MLKTVWMAYMVVICLKKQFEILCLNDCSLDNVQEVLERDWIASSFYGR